MKIAQAHLKDLSDFSTLEPLVQAAPQVVLVFGDPSYFRDSSLALNLKGKFPDSILIGCSSAGEIVNDGAVYDGTLVITAISDEKADFFVASAPLKRDEESFSAGCALGEELSSRGVEGVFVLAPGLNVNGSALTNGLAEALGPHVVVTGGLAGDGPRFQQTHVLFNAEISSSIAVAVGVRSRGALTLTFGSAGGWEPFGPERKVTRAKGNVLYELDGRSALSLYKEYLGEKANDLPFSGLFYPLSIVKDGSAGVEVGPVSGGLIRTVLNSDEKEGSLILAGDVPEGGTLRLMHVKTGGLVAGAVQASSQACDKQGVSEGPVLGILVSCVGRKLVMGPDVDEEVEVVKAALGPKAVVTGFYSYGEICAMGKDNKKPCLHNQTMTITRLGRS